MALSLVCSFLFRLVRILQVLELAGLYSPFTAGFLGVCRRQICRNVSLKSSGNSSSVWHSDQSSSQLISLSLALMFGQSPLSSLRFLNECSSKIFAAETGL